MAAPIIMPGSAMPMGPIIGGHGPIGAMCPMDMLPMAMLLPGGGGGDSNSTNVVRVYQLYTLMMYGTYGHA